MKCWICQNTFRKRRFREHSALHANGLSIHDEVDCKQHKGKNFPLSYVIEPQFSKIIKTRTYYTTQTQSRSHS